MRVSRIHLENRCCFSNMLKRGFVQLDTHSPESHSLKRRCFADQSVAKHYMLHNNLHLSHANTNSNRHCFRDNDVIEKYVENDFLNNSDRENWCLKNELDRVKSLASKKFEQLELVGCNLRQACEEQAAELRRVNEENKLLKRSLLTLNGKRTEGEKELALARDIINGLTKQCSELEKANVTLCVRNHSTSAAFCRQDERGNDGAGGGGPLF